MKYFRRKGLLKILFLICTLVFVIVIFYWQHSLTKFTASIYPVPELKFFPKNINLPKDKPMSIEGIRLGRYLFYDGRLGGSLNPDSLKSCASCHIQKYSFAGKSSSMNQNLIDGSFSSPTIKSSSHDVLPLINLIYNRNGFFWNGIINTENKKIGPLRNLNYQSLEDIVWISIVSNSCLGSTIEGSVDMISSIDFYRPMFKDAFGSQEVNIERIDAAIAQFIRSILAYKFKLYDFLKGEIQFQPDELRGYELFHSEKAGCFHCHAGSLLMTTQEYYNNGISEDQSDSNDRFIVTNYFKDKGAYRAPSLINCELTGPYMHDGRFSTLEEVIDFYSEGIKYSEFIDPLIKRAKEGGIHLEDNEKNDLKAFLLTLTDRYVISDSSLSVPEELGIYGIKPASL